MKIFPILEQIHRILRSKTIDLGSCTQNTYTNSDKTVSILIQKTQTKYPTSSLARGWFFPTNDNQ